MGQSEAIMEPNFWNSWERYYGFSSSHVWTWELDHKEGWVLKKMLWCWKKTLESPLDSKENKPVNPKGNQPWIFIRRIDAEAETSILWPPDGKHQLIRRYSDAGKDWGQEEKGTTEDEMVGWHYRLKGHEFEQALEDSKGQGSQVCCSPWGHKESDTTERLNNSHKKKGILSVVEGKTTWEQAPHTHPPREWEK